MLTPGINDQAHLTAFLHRFKAVGERFVGLNASTSDIVPHIAAEGTSAEKVPPKQHDRVCQTASNCTENQNPPEREQKEAKENCGCAVELPLEHAEARRAWTQHFRKAHQHTQEYTDRRCRHRQQLEVGTERQSTHVNDLHSIAPVSPT